MPDKLVEAKLLPRKAAEAVTYIALVPRLQSHFRFGWGELLVHKDRFQIVTSESPYIRICDFALKAMNDLAPDSVVTALGINRDGHYDLGSRTERNKLGTRLAPPEAWGPWGKKVRESMGGHTLETPMQGGVIHIQMRLPFKDDHATGWLDITVQPSVQIPNNTGVYFRANHHHQPTTITSDNESIDDKDRENTTRLLARLSEGFENSITESESIFEGVIA
jgi:hypothetical protein